ncbi:MAG: UDP-N-acetylmuramate--L-alanine ligase [SAR324 cluster bacterium]|nr:UDP-N-acetylmuramate--L-alanine ligase [SAR324 cluster bacterium]
MISTENPSPQTVHLMGICGTAMTALAGCLQSLGMRVTGSDAHPYPPMSGHLRAMGIEPCEGYRAENIPNHAELVVVGNVIAEANPEAVEMRRRGLPYLSMAAAVKRFAIGDRHAIVVAGTHGKTTTTSLAAHLLVELGADPGFLIGGIARNFGTNFRMGGDSRGGGDLFVIEGDEYDTAYFDKTPKFFKYEPRTLIFTSLEFDHADIYDDLDAIRTQFAGLLRSMPAGGRVIACTDDPNVRGLLSEASCEVAGYGFGAEAQWRLTSWRPDGEGGVFELREGGRRKNIWRIPMPGRYNALNAAAVIALVSGLENPASAAGYPPAAIQAALDAFKGVRRRQEVRGVADGVTVVDDFAHHPTAVRLTVEAMRGRYPGRRLWAVFEPRSFTARGGRFQREFTEALAGADRVVLARPFTSEVSAGIVPQDANTTVPQGANTIVPQGANTIVPQDANTIVPQDANTIVPQDVNTIAPLDVDAIAAELRRGGLDAEALADTEAILAHLTSEARPDDVVLIMSNGGFDDIHDRLLAALHQRTGAPGASGAAITTTAHS